MTFVTESAGGALYPFAPLGLDDRTVTWVVVELAGVVSRSTMAVVLAGCGSDDDVEPSTTADAAEPPAAVTTEATTLPPTSTTDDTTATTLGDFDAAPVSCDVFRTAGDDDVAFFAANFQSALVAARRTGSFEFVADCLDAVPAAYTGEFPACWDECGFARSFVPDFSAPPAERVPDGEFWSSGVAVKYDTPEGPIEAVERWQIRAIDDRYEVSGFSIQVP